MDTVEFNPSRRADAAALLGLAMLAALVFWPILASPTAMTLGHPDSDVGSFFEPQRAFGFNEMRRGNIPLWNPHAVCGAPFLGNFQSALLYPFNLVYLALPLPAALNADMIFHVVLLGFLLYAWMRILRLHPLPAFYAGAVAMFSGPVMFRLLAGHMTLIAVLAWTPLVFAAAHRLYARPTLGWTLLGIFAVTMQTLAGFPQGVYITVFCLAVYSVLRWPRCEYKARTALALAAVCVAPVFLAAAQLVPSLVAGADSIRGHGLDDKKAFTISLRPHSLVSYVVPNFMGDEVYTPFLFDAIPWESISFCGITTLFLGAYGVRRRWRDGAREMCVIALAALLMALGMSTPVYPLALRILPGLDAFRGSARFAIWATLFLIAASAMGLDALRRQCGHARSVKLVLLGGAIVLGLMASSAYRQSLDNSGPGWVAALMRTGQANKIMSSPWCVTGEASVAARMGLGLGLAACTLLALLAIVHCVQSPARRAQGFAVVGVIEVLVFAHCYRSVSGYSSNPSPVIAEFLAGHPGNDRILDPQCTNRVMRAGGDEFWGYEPAFSYRFASFLARSQEVDDLPLLAGGGFPINRFPSIFTMLRCRWVLPSDKTNGEILDLGPTFPRFYFATDYRRTGSPGDALDMVFNGGLDLRKTVVLEQEPDPRPAQGGAAGNVTVLEESTDAQILDVTVDRPAILMITDAYGKGWKASSLLDNAPQSSYTLLPGNYIIRAVPLAAGHHRIRLAYLAGPWRAACAASIASAVLFALLSAYVVVQKARSGRRETPHAARR